MFVVPLLAYMREPGGTPQTLDLLIKMLVWGIELARYGIPAVAFALMIWLLDFMSDQREQPTSADAFLAWRRAWGFTKGLE